MLKICTSISLSALSFVSLSAQGTFPSSGSRSAPAASPAPAQAGGSVPVGGIFESNSFLEMANRIFDPTSDSMDFENGSYSWKGRSFNLAEQRAFRSRFERYLLSSPTDDEIQYAALMEDILERLSVSSDTSDAAILETWELLFRAARFDSDGGNSAIVANQVFNAWRVRKESRGITMSQRELEDIRSYQQEIVANRAFVLQRLKEKRNKETSLYRDNPGESTGGGTESLAGESAFRALDLAETEAKLLALETQSALSGMQTKVQFQSQIVGFFMQRRFEHALVLSGFYQLLFKGSQQQLEVGKEELTAFFPNSDLSFTVDTMGFISREAITDVNKGVVAVNAAYEEGRGMIALERLQETFFLGEYLTELNKIPVAQRRHLLDLYRALIEAGELAEAKDYNGVAEQAETISALSADFPKNRILASVESAKSMSDMAVFAASQYRNIGDIDQARGELQQAIEIWPSNPSIREFQRETTKMATAGSQGVQVFDDLYARGDSRAIYERRMDLGFALASDLDRKPLLMEVVDQVARIDMLVAQSKELLKQGDAYAAWEFLAEAATINGDDAAMNKARAELAPRVANYVINLDRANRLSQGAQPAGALAAYLAAQDVYPASRISREGIERESNRLMESLRQKAE